MNAIEFLTSEHNKVRKLISDISEPSHREKTKKSLFDVICHELLRHELMEQKIWYPKLAPYKDLTDTVQHLLSEEKKAEALMKEIKKIQALEEWEEKVEEFIHQVKHHANEEEKKLFPSVRNEVPSDLLIKIAKEMKEFKKQAEKVMIAA